jgi:hypothetical protein
MFYLIYVLFKLLWFVMLVSVWLVVAAVMLPIGLIMAATSNRSAARDCMRVLDLRCDHEFGNVASHP